MRQRTIFQKPRTFLLRDKLSLIDEELQELSALLGSEEFLSLLQGF